MLFLTQYFPPEVGAPQNRLFELALRLQKKGIHISVLTAMPNYPSMSIHEAYRGKWYHREEMQGIPIYRSWIYVSKSKSIVSRLLNYFSFVFSSFWIGLSKIKKHDLIFCESPPLFLGISAYLLCKLKGAKLIFNVSDLWPESAEKLGLVTNKAMLNMATALEEFLYRSAVMVTGQTQGIVADISGRFPDKQVYWLPNGVDLSYYDPTRITSTWREDQGFAATDRIFLYAGIIGYAQGLDIILQAARQLIAHEEIKFVLLGSGPEKDRLLKLKADLGMGNVTFLDPVSKDEMPNVLKAIDVALVPLKKLELFKGAIPSKIFENLAMKVPIVLGVEGEAYDLFIDGGKAGWAHEPENGEEMAERIKHIVDHPEELEQYGENGRSYVLEHFNRNNIATAFAEQLNKVLSK